INACGDSRLRGLRSRKPIGFRQWVVHPDYVRYTNNATSLPFNLMSEQDIFLCDRNFRGYANPSFGEIQFRPVANTRSGVALIWRKANNKPELKEFINRLDVNPDMWF
ncbi:hypothetical protein, partial [Eubacterium ramulus]